MGWRRPFLLVTLAADKGMALKELHGRWTDAARRTGHLRALEMAFHYESLLSPNPTPLTAMEALAFQLHDRPSLAPIDNDPVLALLDAGWDALPGLIRFRHDPQPTRTPGSFYVRAWPRDTSLMTIGEACEDPLREILVVVPDSDLTALWAGGPREHDSALLASEDEATALSALGRLYSPPPPPDLSGRRRTGIRRTWIDREEPFRGPCDIVAREAIEIAARLTSVAMHLRLEVRPSGS